MVWKDELREWENGGGGLGTWFLCRAWKGGREEGKGKLDCGCGDMVDWGCESSHGRCI